MKESVRGRRYRGSLFLISHGGVDMQRLTVLLLLLCGAFAFTACGSSSTNAGNGQSDSGSPASRGGTVRIAVVQPAQNVDPQAYDGLWQVQDLLFDPLVRYGENGEIQPGIAESWKVSKDGKKYTFQIREGAKFSDGTPVDAKAVEWNFKRWIESPDSDWLGVAAAYRAMRVADPQTFVLQLKKAYPPTLQELGYIRPVRLLSPEAVDVKGKYKEPIGSGAWTLESSNRSGAVLVRNDLYWGSKPNPDRLELKVITDAQSRLSALRAGDVDIIGGDFTAPLTARDVLTLERASNIEVVNGDGTGTLVLAFNEDRAPFDDPAVREAVSLAVDRAAIAKALFQGQAQPAGNLFPASVPYSGDQQPVDPPDPEQAKTLLEQAGWIGGDGVREKNGRKLTMALLTSEESIPGGRAIAEVIQGELKEIGADVEVRLVDHASRHNEIPEREYDLAFYLTHGAPYDPYSTFADLFDSRKDSGVDGKIYTDAQLDPKIDAAFAAQSEKERTQAFDDLYSFLREQHAFLPLIYTPRLWAHGERVEGFQLPPTEYEFPVTGIAVSG